MKHNLYSLTVFFFCAQEFSVHISYVHSILILKNLQLKLEYLFIITCFEVGTLFEICNVLVLNQNLDLITYFLKLVT